MATIVQSYHRPVVYKITLASGDVSSGYVKVYTKPYNTGNLAAIKMQVYTSGGVDKTTNAKVVYTPSTSTTSGIITVTPSSPAYLDTIILNVVYL